MPDSHVLLVDDEPAVLRSLERILIRAGLRVTSAGDGQSALDALAHSSFDVVVSDIAMPGLSGVGLLRAIRRRDLDLPVILITGNPDIQSAIDAVEYGALHYLVKPIGPDLLVSTVERAVRLHELGRLRRQMTAFGDGGALIGDRAGLDARFDTALSRLRVIHQPIVAWSPRTIVGYESFVRSDEMGLETPAALLDAAERLGRLVDLGRAIRNLAAKALAAHAGLPLVFVNLHPRDLLDDALYEERTALGSIAERTVLEINERARLEAVSDLKRRVLELRNRGFRIAIDDIGSGYAGLASFSLLEPDFIKLDTALIRSVEDSLIKRKLIGSLLAVCRDLGIQVVAEGVETGAELRTLVDLGCDLFQGYFLARPDSPPPEVDFATVAESLRPRPS